MRLVISLALALAGSAAPAQNVQAPARPAPARFNPAAPENRHILPNLSYATVEPVLTQIGARFERRGTTPERPLLQVQFANGRRAAILFASCERGGLCKAISIQAVWNRPPNAPPGRLEAGIQSFNQRYAFARAFITADGRPALQRYLTADYGIIRGNLAVNLLVFANQVDRFVAEVLRPSPPAR